MHKTIPYFYASFSYYHMTYCLLSLFPFTPYVHSCRSLPTPSPVTFIINPMSHTQAFPFFSVPSTHHPHSHLIYFFPSCLSSLCSLFLWSGVFLLLLVLCLCSVISSLLLLSVLKHLFLYLCATGPLPAY